MNDSFAPEQHINQTAEEEIPHLRDYLRIITKRKLTILTIFVIILLITIIRTYTTTPIYTASSHVLIERNLSPSALDTGIYSSYDPNFMATQLELIRSTNVALKVVNRLELDTKYRHYFFNNEKANRSSPFSSIKGFVSSIFSLEPNEQTTDAPNNAEQLNRPAAKTDAEIIAARIRDNLSIKPVKGTKTVLISYSDTTPVIAKLIVDSIVQAYIDEILEIKLSTSRYSQQWMTNKAEEERQKLADAEKNLHQYVKKNDLVTVENKLNSAYPEKLAELSSQLTKVQAELKEYETLYNLLQTSAKNYKQIETLKVFTSNETLQQLHQKISLTDQTIRDLSKKYGPKHPAMIKARTEHDLLTREKTSTIDRIVDATRNSYELAKAREVNLKQLIAKTKTDMLNVNERFMQYSIMKREVDMNQALYNSLTSSIKKATVTEQTQDVKIWVLRKADLPEAPSKPDKKRSIAMGLILGLLGGIGMAFFLEYLDNTVKNGEGIEKRFGLTVLGSVEELQGKSDHIETYLLKNPLSPLAESYRLIRSGLLLSSPDHPPRSILITSMVPQEGKTSTTSNLARILAQNNKKVLIIDCDMRRPRMHSLFGMPNSHGLSSYLSGNTDKSPICASENELVFLIPSGPVPPNPAELLHSTKMQLLVGEMLKKYDYVLLDSPPIQSVTDSLTLSSLVDGTLLVTRSGKTTFDMIESGLKKLHDVRATILGVVLNGLIKSKHDSGYYGYYDYYSSLFRQICG
ncbi:MAG: polysaccharide biosynthesis tyrosine autokinase [Desulfocapsa sp.]|nr:polysaccharide biosynthesis tyrosine autokinase [Desulfocapsa sp.]